MARAYRFRRIGIEASSLCQLRCPSCPTTRGLIHPAIGSGYLDVEAFRRLLDTNEWIREVELSNYGEMFLNPGLLEILEIAHERDVRLRADNGVNLNRVDGEVLDGLARYGFRSMTCSIDGASSETYSKYRSGGDFDRVIGNIEALNSFKKKHGTEFPVLSWQYILFGHNQDELPEATALASSLHMNFCTKLSWDSDFSPWNPDIARKEFGTASREEFRRIHGRDYMQMICIQLWYRPQVNWDGRVLGCCRNFWGDFGGNIFEEGSLAALNSEKISYARGMILGRCGSRDDIPCTTCNIYRTMRDNGTWLDIRTARRFRRKGGWLAPRGAGRVLRRFYSLAGRFI